MKKILFLTLVALTGWLGVSWAGSPPPAPEIPGNAAPIVVAGIAALVFAVKGYMSRK